MIADIFTDNIHDMRLIAKAPEMYDLLHRNLARMRGLIEGHLVNKALERDIERLLADLDV